MNAPSVNQLAHERKLRQDQIIVWFFRGFILFFFIVLWEVSTRLGWIDGFIFSSPSRIVTTFIDMWNNNQLYMHIGITLLEMQNLGPHSRLTESEYAFKQDSQMIQMYIKIGEAPI